ncbi:MAG: hypothetical protein IT193_20245 [Propionibacteriaceae bacterium]|nr:hypothetical protein [Propionibacteriaceae bacterium]
MEKDFDLGAKFETKEAADSAIDPRTGVQAWSEPFVALYVSFDSLAADGTRRHGSLRYALGRSKWSDQAASSAVDEQTLLAAAKPFLAEDLSLLRRGGTPDTVTEFMYL